MPKKAPTTAAGRINAGVSTEGLESYLAAHDQPGSELPGIVVAMKAERDRKFTEADRRYDLWVAAQAKRRNDGDTGR